MTIRRRGYFETGVCFAVGLFIMLMGGAYIALAGGFDIAVVEVLGVPVEAAVLFALGGVFWIVGCAFLPKARATVAGAAPSRTPAQRHRRVEATKSQRSASLEGPASARTAP